MPEHERESGGRRRDRDRERSQKRRPSDAKHRSNNPHALSADALAALSSGEAQAISDDRQRDRPRKPRDDDADRERRRERRERRERRDRREAEEREARRQREEIREMEEREAALSAPRQPQTDSEAESGAEAEPETRRHSRPDRERRRERTRTRESRGTRDRTRDRTRSRHYTEDERTDHERTDHERTDHDSDRQRHRSSRHREGTQRTRPERTPRPSNSRAKYSSLQGRHGDYESDSGYDRVVADGTADRRHQWKRDRRIPSGAVLEEGRSRGVWDAAAAGGAAGAAAGAAVSKKPKNAKSGKTADKSSSSTGSSLFGWRDAKPAAAAPSKSKEKSPSGFSFGWRVHLRGGMGGQSSTGSGDSRNSMDRAKENLYYSNGKPKKKPEPWSKKKKMVVFGGLGSALLILIIVIVAVVVSKKGSKDTSSSSSSSSSSGSVISGVPTDAPSWLNPYKWVSTTDFNLTYTNETVGGLPIMGLNTSYDDSKSANSKTPALNEDWGSYGTTPARGVNLGGWLSLEPFITPSLFSGYPSSLGIIDEYTLCAYLGSAKCASTLESHYATFVTESTFEEIAAAGLDHVRIQYSYWAVAVYDDDPYLYRTSWRYLLRGIEWARKHGLRVNLDMHGLPGSQNGWNHSGRQGAIGWMNGTDGDLNVQRSLDVHDRLSQFFAQPRYKNVLSHYGLANEPRMTFLSISSVMNWTQEAAALIRKNGVSNDTIIVFSDGFCGLTKWQGEPNTYNLALDVHQYEIFNNEQIVYTHEEKIKYACSDWTAQTEQSMDTSTGFGPTIIAEWSQADTDCANYLGNVGNGNRWTGTYDVGNASLNALTPKCPAQNSSCSCTQANTDVSSYSDEYKSFLLTFAEAQMEAFERGWGWWYWTWDTESAPQWSYKKGRAAGILPADASTRSFSCDSSTIPSFDSLSEFY